MLLVVLMFIYGFVPPPRSRLAPGVRCCSRSSPPLASGSGSPRLNVSYRDVRYAVPFLIQLWMFATPSPTRQPRPEAVAGAVRTEPDGRRRRGLPLGAAR